MSDTGTPPPSPVTGGRPPMSGAGKVGIVLLGLMVLVLLIWMNSGGSQSREEQGVGASMGAPGTIRRIEPLPPPAFPEMAAVPVPMPPPRPVELTPRPPRPRQATRAAPIMAYEAPAAQRDPSTAVAGRPGEETDDPLASRLQATRTEAVRARRIRNPDFTLAMGTIIPCTPLQPLNTQLEGFQSCVVPVDVRGMTGRIVLLDRGTRIVGQVRSGMRQGQNRAFILWTDATTPDGTRVALASPGTDARGQNGLDVDVETNFWSRFGASLMLSFVDAGLQAAALGASSALSQGTGQTLNLYQFQSAGRSAAATALDHDIRIPPYGTRPQGEPSAIFLARDADFSLVFTARTTP